MSALSREMNLGGRPHNAEIGDTGLVFIRTFEDVTARYEKLPTQTMTPHIDSALPHIDLIRAAPEQAPILANLLELYAHDFSEFHDIDLGEDGRFGYGPLPLYWSEPDRYPFLIKLDGKWAGLALVKKGSQVSGNDDIWDMAEFFIVRGCRRCGIGSRVAHEVWRRFPGPWEVRVMQANVAAQHFWARAISGFTGEAIHPGLVEKAGKCWSVFSFESKPAPHS
jgi:predicted acetyltransferase